MPALISLPATNKTPMFLEQLTADQSAQLVATIDEYNTELAARLAAFSSKNTGVTAKIVDTAAPFNKAINNPTAYGAPNATCYNSDGTSCLWFNNYHPGIAINKLVAEAVAEAWEGSFFSGPSGRFLSRGRLGRGRSLNNLGSVPPV
jgi:phospholipase/lecithinase/hemolysin